MVDPFNKQIIVPFWRNKSKDLAAAQKDHIDFAFPDVSVNPAVVAVTLMRN